MLKLATPLAPPAAPKWPGWLAATRAGHLATAAGSAGADSGAQRYAAPSQTHLDRNTVDMDRERASFADNTVKYEATLRFIGAQAKTALSAITGQ